VISQVVALMESPVGRVGDALHPVSGLPARVGVIAVMAAFLAKL
jgi:hypothetical protein